MSAGPLSRIGWLWLLLCACRAADPAPGGPAVRPQSSPSAQAAAPFVAPGDDGWGEVEGLRYLELVTGGASSDQTLPLVVFIHGMGDMPRRQWFSPVQLPPMRLVMPQAPKPYGGGFSWFDYRVVDVDTDGLARGIAAAAAQLARAIGSLRDHRPTLGRPIIMGFSQGGMLSYALALSRPDLVSASIPISGMLPAGLWPTKRAGAGQPTIRALHGDADEIVPAAQDRRLAARLRELGYDVELHEFSGVRHVVAAPVGAAMSSYLLQALAAVRDAERNPVTQGPSDRSSP